MRRGQGGRMPIPTKQQFEKAVLDDSEIVACSALKPGPIAALAMSLDNGGTATVCVTELGAVNLVATLKALFPGCDSPPGSPAIITKTEEGIAVQAGHMSDDEQA
jgi:hypothetical protein